MREQILAETTRLFAARGFDGTSLQGIAEAVGIRKASLLYHFESKEALRLAVLEQLFDHWKQTLPKLLLAASSGTSQFDELVAELVGFFTSDPDRARLLLREVLDRPDEMRALLQTHVTPWVEVIGEHIERGKRAGVVRVDVDPEAYVVLVINLVVGSVATHECMGSLVSESERRARLDRHVAELRRLTKAGLFVPEVDGAKDAPRSRRGRARES